jgi:hypothetical protein
MTRQSIFPRSLVFRPVEILFAATSQSNVPVALAAL